MIDRKQLLSPHFTLKEMTKTRFMTPDRNEPPLEAILNMIDLCDNWLEPLRERYNRQYVLAPDEDYNTSKDVEPLVINQGFRSYQVMLAMQKAGYRPSTSSNHMKGCAVDIGCTGKQQAQRYMQILQDIANDQQQAFDELLEERMMKQGKPVYWVHFAARPENNRCHIKYILK
ncbi:MAG: hypothetical protein IJR07_10435 [Bacteroidaceae bacterium]|nr:hypothetical protein [Bacteroidaceae bacterium]